MKRTILALLFVALLVFGCASEQPEEDVVVEDETEDVGGEDNTEDEMEEAPDTEEVEEEQEPETEQEMTFTAPIVLNEKLESGLANALEANEPADVFQKTATKPVAVGDTVVFALGMNNIYTQTKEFQPVVRFHEARDTRNSRLSDVDPAYVETWVSRNNIDAVTVEPSESATVAIGVDVRDTIAEGVATQPGKYNFKADVVFQDGNFEKQHASIDFFVWVE